MGKWFKNKFVAALAAATLAVVAVLTVHYVFFYEPCVEPSQKDVEANAFFCGLQMNMVPPEEMMTHLCKELGRPSGCELHESDREALIKILEKDMISCVKNALRQSNMCTHNVEKTLRGE